MVNLGYSGQMCLTFLRLKGEKEDYYYVSVTQVSREFIFLIEVLKMFHPPYKSKRHGPWFKELPIQNKQATTTKKVSPL